MKSLLEIAREMDQIFATERQWTQGTMARDFTGTPAGVMDPDATCWCWTGAYRKAAGYTNDDEEGTQDEAKIMRLHQILMVTSVVVWNDSDERTFQDVKEGLAKIIKELS
jgi:hypothetical protein